MLNVTQIMRKLARASIFSVILGILTHSDQLHGRPNSETSLCHRLTYWNCPNHLIFHEDALFYMQAVKNHVIMQIFLVYHCYRGGTVISGRTCWDGSDGGSTVNSKMLISLWFWLETSYYSSCYPSRCQISRKLLFWEGGLQLTPSLRQYHHCIFIGWRISG